jgi:hypothetical protein
MRSCVWVCLPAAACVVGFCGKAFAAEVATTHVASEALSAKALEKPAPEVVAPFLFAGLGAGFPELANAQLGVYLHPRVTIEAVYGWLSFNHMLGLGLTGYFFGTPRQHATPAHTVTVSAYVRNNLGQPFGATSVRETIGVTAEAGLGYAYHAAFGLRVTGQVLGFVTPERHTVTGGPLLRLSVGWVFPFGVE